MPLHRLRVLLAALAVALLSVATVPPEEVHARARDDTPEALYEKGERQMRRGYYDEAIATFDKVRNHFPLNPYSVKAELRVADCLFEKGEYVAAIDAYRNFQRLHPSHPDLDYVVFRIASAHFKGSHIIAQRDQSSTDLCLRTLEGYESRFPESRYLAEVQRMRAVARKRLAKRIEDIGDYYYWRGRLRRGRDRATAMHAAARRYEQLVQTYPDLPLAERGWYRLGMARLHLGDVRGAEEAFSHLSDGSDGRRRSRYIDRARQALKRPPKPVAPPEETAGPIVPSAR